MDLHFGSQLHQAMIAANTPRAGVAVPNAQLDEPCLEKQADHDCSWVMLKQNGEIEPLNDENIVLKTPDHVSLELRVPQGLRTDNPDFSIKCDDGVALIFNHGGIDAYHSKYSLMYERLNHARDVGRETGARITVHDDDLPPYTPAGAGAAPAQSPSEPPSTEAPAQAQRQQSQPTPAEPPPGYDEAQAQAVEQQFDERDRQDAERAQ